MKTIQFVLLTLIPLFNSAQSAEELLSQVVSKYSKVNDYSASILIKADVPMIKALPVRANIYFKKKDKFRIVSKSIAILPKKGFTDVNVFLADPSQYMVVDAGSKKISGIETRLLTVISNASSNDIILAKLWVHPDKYVVLESEVTTRSSGTVKLKYTYSDQIDYGLPSSITFIVDVKEFKMPKSMTSNIHRSGGSKMDKRKSGTIVVTISDYKVNEGVSDSIFKN